MTTKRDYPESYRPVHHRAPRVAELHDGRIAALGEPGFEAAGRVVLHVCDRRPAREGLGPGLPLVAPEGGVFACRPGDELVAGIWCDAGAKLWLAWSDGQAIHVRRTRELNDLTTAEAWETLDTIALRADGLHLGSGAVRSSGSLVLAAAELPAGRILLSEVGEEGACVAELATHALNHTPSLALDPDGQRAHVVWDTEDLRILYRDVTLDNLRVASAGAAGKGDIPHLCEAPFGPCGQMGNVPFSPLEVWYGCHHPDVATNGREIIVAYTDHMHFIKYGFHDGRQWHRDLHLTTLHPRFTETVEHSPWLWTDGDGVLHLSFVCLTRPWVYDSRWLGEGFSDPQPVEGLMHPSAFCDEARVKAERLSLARDGGTMLLSSSFLPERHGLYTRTQAPVVLRPNEPLLFLDSEDVAEVRNLEARLETMRTDPAEPILEPTDREEDFDGGRVLNGGTILLDGGRYRMWYGAMPIHTDDEENWYDQVLVGYAESDDGITWRRTPTGLDTEFRGRPAPNRIAGVDHNACVFIDPSDTPSRRYKAVKFETRAQRLDHVLATGEGTYLGLPRRGWLATSPDGLAWEREEIVVEFPGPEPYGFTPQKALYDPADPDPNRRFKAIGYASLVARRRGAMVATSPDARHWIVEERSPTLDSTAAVTPVRSAGPYGQIHDAGLDRYGRYLLAFYGYQFDGESEDIRLAVSRDGHRYNYVFPETPLVALGGSGTWNSGYMMPVDLCIDGEQMAYFYGCNPLQGPESGTTIPSWRVCAGRAVAKRDRFVRLSPREAGQPALLRTVPVAFEGEGLTLSVNAALRDGSVLRVGLVSAERPLPGFEPEACGPITGDSLAHAVRWRAHSVLPTDVNRFRIELHLQGQPDDALYGLACSQP